MMNPYLLPSLVRPAWVPPLPLCLPSLVQALAPCLESAVRAPCLESAVRAPCLESAAVQPLSVVKMD